MNKLPRDSMTPQILRQHFIYDPVSGKIHRRLGDQEWSIAGKESFFSKTRNYLGGTFQGHDFLAHRVAWAIHFGEWPADQIDHINGDGRDNRLSNLRVVTNLENCRNLGRRQGKVGPDSGVNGVYWHKQSRKWMARIKKNGAWIYLGTHADLSKAIEVRRAAEKAVGFHPNHGRRAAIPKSARLSP